MISKDLFLNSTGSFFANVSELEPHYTVRGVPYYPLWRAVPALAPFYTPFEKAYNAAPAVIFMYEYSWLPVVVTVLYLIFCYQGPRIMDNHKPYRLKSVLATWNLVLSLLSLVGAMRVGSHLLYLLSPWGGYTFRDTVCRPPEESYGDNATGFWCVVFTLSKLAELMDTVFVVLRKKSLIFLHWYHHTTVLLVSWFGHVTLTPALYFITINYSIHAVMYLYFFLSSIQHVPRWFNPLWLTTAQISQMFVGIYVTVKTVYYKYGSGQAPCHVDDHTLAFVLVMYASYLYLFLDFFVRRAVLRGSSSTNEGGKTTTMTTATTTTIIDELGSDGGDGSRRKQDHRQEKEKAGVAAFRDHQAGGSGMRTSSSSSSQGDRPAAAFNGRMGGSGGEWDWEEVGANKTKTS